MTVTTKITWSLRVNRATTWRERLGNALRRLAGRIDGRWSLGIEIVTQPPIGITSQGECLFQGYAAMSRAIRSETEAEAIEGPMRKYLSETQDRD